jgi:hypothetical protein
MHCRRGCARGKGQCERDGDEGHHGQQSDSNCQQRRIVDREVESGPGKLRPGVPGHKSSENEDRACDELASLPHPGIIALGLKEQFGQLNRYHHHPETFVAQLEEEVDPIDPKGASVDMGGVDADQRSQGGLLDETLFRQGQHETQQQDRDPSKLPSANQAADEQGATAPGADFWQQDVQSGETGRAEKDLGDDGRQQQQRDDWECVCSL